MSISTYEPRKIVIKSRGRSFGKRKSPEEIMQDITKLASDGHSMKKIHQIIGKSRSQVHKYLQKANKLGLIEKTESGRVKISQQVKIQRQYEAMSKDEFLNTYPCVKTWFDNKIGETKGDTKKIERMRGQLSQLKTVCDTLELNPYSILATIDGLAYGGAKNALNQFSIAMINNQVKYASKSGNKRHILDDISTALYIYVQTVRSFCVGNSIIIPERIEGILSGKKISYGKYAHIKLTFDRINDCVTLLGKKYGYASREQALFVFYYLTCARKAAGLNIQVDHIEKDSSGWITCQIHETKTNTTWTKFIPDDNPHQQIFLDYLETRKNKQFLFADSEVELRKIYNQIPNVFKEIYKELGITENYFYEKPVHVLRHIGAHYWLNRIGYNHSIVANIGGWKSVQTLIDCYGSIPADYIIQALKGYKNA